MVTTGEDVDLESRYEELRMSPLLIAATQTMTYQAMSSPNDAGKKFRFQNGSTFFTIQPSYLSNYLPTYLPPYYLPTTL